MTFGSQTVTLIKRAPSNDPDELGTYAMAETVVNMPNCLHRPVEPAGERGAGRAIAEEQPAVGVSAAIRWWRTTVPVGSYGASLRAAVLGAQASDQLRYTNPAGEVETFQIIGAPEPHPDFAYPFAKVTFISEKQTIGT